MSDIDKTKEQLISELVETPRRITELVASEIQRKRAEEKLRESEERYRAIVEVASQAGEGICIMQASSELGGVIVFANDELARILGRAKEETIGMPSKNVIAPDSFPNLFENFRRKMRGEEVGYTEILLTRKDGTMVPVEVGMAAITYQGRGSMVAYIRDITERKRAEEALRESERRYRLLAENATDVIWTMDMNLRPTYLSPSVTRMLGYSTEEALTKRLEEGLTPASLEVAVKAFAEELVIENMEQKDMSRSRMLELEMICKDGSTIWTETHVTFLRDPDGQPVGIVGVIRDITERKRMEEELQHHYEQEKELRQRLEEEIKRRVEFTRALVHELKTPVTPILASSDLLVEQLQEGPSLKLAKNIKEGASTMNRRIDALLDLARGELGVLQLNHRQMDPLQLLHQVASEMSPMASRHELSLVLDVPRSLPSAWVDVSRLQQVIVNLLTNAFKWSPQGGNVTLRAKQKNDALIVEVQDMGPGIAKEKQPKIFEAYYRVESDRQRLDGLGLGLALCKTIVESHGGKIWVESEKGEGSTFGFSVPLHSDVD